MTERIPAWVDRDHPGHTVAEIVRMLTLEGSISAEAGDALTEIGESALPDVLVMLDDPDPFAQEAACYALSALARGDGAWLAMRATALQEQLLPFLQSAHDRVRRAACGAAGSFGDAPLATIERLRENLVHPDEDVWRAAAFALARLGVWSSDLSAALHRVMTDTAWIDRWMAARILVEHEPGPTVEAVLRELLAAPMNEVWRLDLRHVLARHGWLRPGEDAPAPFPEGGGVIRWLGGRERP